MATEKGEVTARWRPPFGLRNGFFEVFEEGVGFIFYSSAREKEAARNEVLQFLTERGVAEYKLQEDGPPVMPHSEYLEPGESC